MQPQTLTAKSGASNRLLFGCLMLFAATFLAGGLVALVQGIRQYAIKPNAIVAIIVGGVFTVVGLLLMLGIRYAASASAKTDELKAQNPDKPWMWRNDWASRAIKDSNKSGAIGLWIFALLWNSISFPMAFLIARPELAEGNLAALLILLFPLVGVFLLIGAIYQTLRSMKFGTSTCHLEHVPIVPGRTFRGDIELTTDATPQNGYRLRIASMRAVTTGTGKNRSTSERLLWDAEIVVDTSAAIRSPIGTRIPFVFATPPDAHTTARHPLGATAGVQLTRLPGGGEEFRIHARKTFGSVFKSLLFLAIWNAAIVAMFHFHTPWGFPAVFIALDALFILASIDYFLGRSTITVDSTGVRVRKQWLGAGSTKSYEAAEIVSIDGATASQNSTSSGVMLKLKDGSTRQLGSYFPDRESADSVAAKMMADLGRT